MHTSDYCLVVIVLFFALLLYSVHQEEKRSAERRLSDLPGMAERRGPERRQPQSQVARLGWAVRTRWVRAKAQWNARH